MATKRDLKIAIFVQEYAIDENGTRAAIAAGWAASGAHVEASHLLKNPKVLAMIQEIQAKKIAATQARAAKVEITEDRWRDEVAKIAFSDSLQPFEVDEDGKPRITIADMKKRGLGAMIRKLRVLPGGKLEFEMHPKLPALELLAKHFGWVTEKVDATLKHSGTIQSSAMTQETLKKIHANPKAQKLALELAEAMAELPADPAQGGKDGKV